MKKFIRYFLERLKERSTWLSLLALISVFGVQLSPDQVQAIVSAAVAVAALIGAFTRG